MSKVVLHQFEELPGLIKCLIDNSHPISKHFFDNSRRYNTLFQITSFGANEIAEGKIMPSFKIQGQVHHLIGSLLPEIGNNARFLQIYFMSESDQISISAVPKLCSAEPLGVRSLHHKHLIILYNLIIYIS
jgi:hypothetical protein